MKTLVCESKKVRLNSVPPLLVCPPLVPLPDSLEVLWVTEIQVGKNGIVLFAHTFLF